MKRTKKIDPIILALFAFLFIIPLAGSGAAQTTAFIYQGKLTDAGNLANGTYDMQFKLFDTATVGTGTQQGATITNPTVQVTAGSFTVTLDFGANVFTGAARFLEIGVRLAGNPNPHTILAPRQAIHSAPYAIQTVNTQQLGGLPANRYVASDVNGNVGIGTVSPVTRLEVVHPASQLRFGFSTVDNGGYLISTHPSQAIIAGGGAWNGANWVAKDTVASLTAHQNGVIQFLTNSALSVGSPFEPTERMRIDQNGDVGIGTANPQSRLAVQAFSPGYGITHTDGTVTVGSYIDAQGGWLGTRSNHSLHFFTNDSTPRMTMDTSGNVGIGTTGPTARLHSVGATGIGVFGESSSGWGVYGFSSSGIAVRGFSNTGLAGSFTGNVSISGNVAVSSDLTVQGRTFVNLFSNGITQVCENNNGELATCSSSLRYKKDLQPFADGLLFINKLRPISYKWKSNDAPDIGFGAEDVEIINPLFVTYNQKGEVEGVKYDRLSVLFVNAFKEQQQLLERQQQQIEQDRKLLTALQTQLAIQQREVEGLKRLICHARPKAEICKGTRRTKRGKVIFEFELETPRLSRATLEQRSSVTGERDGH